MRNHIFGQLKGFLQHSVRKIALHLVGLCVHLQSKDDFHILELGGVNVMRKLVQ